MKISIGLSRRRKNKNTSFHKPKNKTKHQRKMNIGKDVDKKIYKFNRKKIMRDRLLRSFQPWYYHNESKLPFRLYIDACYKKRLILRIKDINPAIFIRLGRNEMDIWAETDDCSDILAMIFCSPVRDGNVYKDTSLIEEYSHLRYSSRKDVWEKELFESCAEWISNNVVTAKRIRFYSSASGGFIWAELEKIESENKNSKFIIRYDLPVHIDGF